MKQPNEDVLTLVNTRSHFKSVLDSSWISDTNDALMIYFAKVHTSYGIGPVLGWVFFLVIMIQMCVPAFFVVVDELWKDQSVIFSILKILMGLSIGPYTNSDDKRVSFSSILISANMIMIISIMIRSHFFTKKRNQSKAESIVSLIIYKYGLIAILPMMCSGIPNAYYNIFKGKF